MLDQGSLRGVAPLALGVLILRLGGPALSWSQGSAAARPPEERRGPAGDAEHLRYATVNGVKLAYRAEGAGFPVIFVHGEGFSHELWAAQLQPFRQKHLVITYDRRGHGQSEATVLGYSPLAHAEDLNALMNHLGGGEAHFVVHSRGGAIITQFLRFYPQKVRSVIFADAAILLVPPSKFFRAGLERRLREPLPTLEQALKRREDSKRSPLTKIAQSKPELRAVLERIINQVSPHMAMDPQQSDFTAAINVGPWNDREFPDMVKLARPILLVVGELTDSYFIDGAKAALRAWPNARFHMIPRTDHFLPMEEPAEFNRIALEFLAEVDAGFAGRHE